MNVEHSARYIGKDCQSDRTVVDKCPGTPGRRYLPSQYYLLSVPLGVKIAHLRGGSLVNIRKCGFYGRTLLLVGYHADIGPLPKQKRQGTEHDQLAGPCLAGDYGQAAAGPEIECVDQCVVGYQQLT